MTTNTRNTLIICAVVVACTAFTTYHQWPEWQAAKYARLAAREAQGTAELRKLVERKCPQGDVAAWLERYRDHRASRHVEAALKEPYSSLDANNEIVGFLNMEYLRDHGDL